MHRPCNLLKTEKICMYGRIHLQTPASQCFLMQALEVQQVLSSAKGCVCSGCFTTASQNRPCHVLLLTPDSLLAKHREHDHKQQQSAGALEAGKLFWVSSSQRDFVSRESMVTAACEMAGTDSSNWDCLRANVQAHLLQQMPAGSYNTASLLYCNQKNVQSVLLLHKMTHVCDRLNDRLFSTVRDKPAHTL